MRDTKDNLRRLYIILIFAILLLCTSIVSAQIATPQCVMSPAGLVAWFSANGTQIVDRVLNEVDPDTSHYGGLWQATYEPAIAGNGFSLNGVNARVVIPDANYLDLTGSFTLDAWIKPNSLNCVKGWCAIVSKSDYTAGKRNYGLWVSTAGALLISYRNTAGAYVNSLSAAGTIAAGRSYHVAGVEDKAAGALRLYLNGALIPSTTKGDPKTAPAVNDVPLTVGSSDPGYDYYFNGLIDEVHIFNQALSDVEVNTLSTTTSGNRGLCRLNEIPQRMPTDILYPDTRTTLDGPNVKVSWLGQSSEPDNWDTYHLKIGNSVNGVEHLNKNLGKNSSWNVTGLPVDSRTLYARIWWGRTPIASPDKTTWLGYKDITFKSYSPSEINVGNLKLYYLTKATDAAGMNSDDYCAKKGEACVREDWLYLSSCKNAGWCNSTEYGGTVRPHGCLDAINKPNWDGSVKRVMCTNQGPADPNAVKLFVTSIPFAEGNAESFCAERGGTCVAVDWLYKQGCINGGWCPLQTKDALWQQFGCQYSGDWATTYAGSGVRVLCKGAGSPVVQPICTYTYSDWGACT